MQPSRVFDLLKRLQEKFPKEDALAAKENGAWRKWSTTEFTETVDHLASGLLLAGLGKGDRIGIISNNRPEWNIADYATQRIAAVSVPIYPTISETDLAFILKDAEVKLIFVSSEDLYQKVKSVATVAAPQMSVYCFNTIPGSLHWTELTASGKSHPQKDKIEALSAAVNSNDLFTILYTSGTTGVPKGVMLSHANLLSNCMATESLAPFRSDWRALSFLPLNHVYERMLNTLYIYLGISIYYAESLETIGENLKEVKPQIFVTVPRLLEKVYDKIVAKGAELSGVKKKLFFWALNLGLQFELEGKSAWYSMQLSLANKLIFSKWREALGGNIVAVCSGGAALQPRLARVFNAAQIKVLEGYGLTETSPVVAVNTFWPGGMKFGTVGPVIEKVEVKLADDGEILVKGPNVMLGYYKRPDLTAEVMDTNGYFRTGDIGTFIDGKFLKITDRKKEIFKTSGGKYIAPLAIENKLKESPFIEQAMVIGEGQKFPSAFITPTFAALESWAQKKGININDRLVLVEHPEVKALFRQEVEKANTHLAQYEKIKREAVLPAEWSVNGGELTPKLSLKRKVILEKNKSVYDRIYAE
ncbi:MAG: long-chain fatty acid--CoA ligase [Bacteroidia bacterium]|nr:long-chain fatty acid--CoA ligase [Bacteroidia bacterium]